MDSKDVLLELRHKRKSAKLGSRSREPRRSIELLSHCAGIGLEKPRLTWSRIWQRI